MIIRMTLINSEDNNDNNYIVVATVATLITTAMMITETRRRKKTKQQVKSELGQQASGVCFSLDTCGDTIECFAADWDGL